MAKFIRKFALTNLLVIVLIWPNNVFSQNKLEKVKEFKINSLHPVELIDYLPQEGLYLGYINKFSEELEITLVNEEGEIIIHKNLEGEGPDQSVAALNSMAFSDDGDIWIQTPHELLLYDQKLNLKKRIRYPSSLQIYLYGIMEVFPYFYNSDALSGFSFITNPSGACKYLDNRDFSISNLIDIFHLGLDKSYEMAPVSERPLAKNLDRSVGAIYFPVYALDRKKSKLYMTTSIDNEITVYDLITNKIASRIKVVHGEFKSLKNTSITSKSLPSYKHITLASRNHKIFQLDGGLIVLNYIREISEGTYEKKIADDPGYHHFRDPEYHRLILFDGTKQLTNDLSVPPNGTIKMGLPNNRLLVRLTDPDVEEDFIRYGIYKVSKTEK
jgi:hypothetical protein